MKGNKGEWSEVYVFLKLLGDGELPIGDANLNRWSDYAYPVISVIREELKGNPIKYDREELYVSVTEKGEEYTLRIPIDAFRSKSELLFQKIKAMKSVQEFPEIESFLKEINCTKVKASSSQKTDIEIVIYDSKLGLTPKLGFSIKSQLGSPATLLNASQATNFKYQLSQVLSDKVICEVNSIVGSAKVRKRLAYLAERGINISFLSVPNAIFKNNLMLVDTSMPEIISYILQYYYEGKGSKISTLVKILEEENPLGYSAITPSFYEYKIKKLLVEIALGMTPAKQWTGVYDATGGYIVVKESGEVLCYHVYNRNLFEEYLFYNTQLDTPSTSRHSFGKIGEDECLNLNLQIRFI